MLGAGGGETRATDFATPNTHGGPSRHKVLVHADASISNSNPLQT
jgi:hypothetical protein